MERFKTMKRNKHGECLVGLAVAAPLLGLLLSALFALSAAFAARQLLDLDAYRLARAHLYSQDRGLCKASRLWPEPIREKVVARCSGNGWVMLRWSDDFASRRLVMQASIDLRPSWSAP